MNKKVRFQDGYLVEVLRQLRIELEKRRLTQIALSRQMKKGHGYINGLVQRRHSLTLEKLFEVLRELKLTPAEFFLTLNGRLRGVREPAERARLMGLVGEVVEMTGTLREVFEQLVRSGVLTRDDVDAANARARAAANWGVWQRYGDETPPS